MTIELTRMQFAVWMLLAFYLGGFVRAFSHTVHLVTSRMPIENTAAAGKPALYWMGLLYVAIKTGLLWPLNKLT